MKASPTNLFCLYLLIIILLGVTIALINRYLRLHGMTSQSTPYVWGSVLFVLYYYAWRWLYGKLGNHNNK